MNTRVMIDKKNNGSNKTEQIQKQFLKKTKDRETDMDGIDAKDSCCDQIAKEKL